MRDFALRCSVPSNRSFPRGTSDLRSLEADDIQTGRIVNSGRKCSLTLNMKIVLCRLSDGGGIDNVIVKPLCG